LFEALFVVQAAEDGLRDDAHVTGETVAAGLKWDRQSFGWLREAGTEGHVGAAAVVVVAPFGLQRLQVVLVEGSDPVETLPPCLTVGCSLVR
jgi:hypothetical protein